MERVWWEGECGKKLENRAINRITKEDRAFLRVGTVRGHRWERQGNEGQEGKKAKGIRKALRSEGREEREGPEGRNMGRTRVVQRKSEARKGSGRVQCMRNIEMRWLIWKERDAIEGDARNQKERAKMALLKRRAGESGRWAAR